MGETIFKSKAEAVHGLQNEFEVWDSMMSRLGDQDVESVVYKNRSKKDDVAHLWEWQRITAERLQVAIDGSQPLYGWVPKVFADDIDGHTDEYNDYLYEKNKHRSWEEVYEDWRTTFVGVIEQASLLTDEMLFTSLRYEWLFGYRLVAVLEGTLNHHQEHREWWKRATNVQPEPGSKGF